MKAANFQKLTPRQQHVMLVAMYLRNAMEDFHAHNLSNAQMKELNQLIRQALYNIVTIIETDEADVWRDRTLSHLVGMIPDYWELPKDEDWR